jgi:diguanylate cyclase (GGDEF)-like protein
MPAVSEAVAAAPPSTVLAARQLAIALVVAAIVHLVLAHAVADVLAALGPGSRAFAATGLMLMAIALPVWFLACVPLLRAGREAVAAQMQASALLNERLRVHDLDVRLAAALEMAEDEDAVLRIARQALAVAADGAPAQLLLADTPDGAMRHSLVQGELPEEVRCYIGRPCDCPSVRRGMGTVYEDSMVLSACRGLKGPISAACAAACTPITVAGSGVGMVRALGPAGDPVLYRLLQTLNTAAHHVGARLAVIRSISASERQAATDPLTGAANRRSAESRIAELARSGEAYAMAMVDIDHFKHINDHHGHDVGDQALKLLVGVIRESIRDGDTLCRQGGEEFLLVFPGGDAAFAELVLQRLRSELPRACARARLPVFTFSAGIADGPLARPETMLRAADAALYRAKESGRDRILRSEPGEGEAATA